MFFGLFYENIRPTSGKIVSKPRDDIHYIHTNKKML
jgi:hypothetical protein